VDLTETVEITSIISVVLKKLPMMASASVTTSQFQSKEKLWTRFSFDSLALWASTSIRGKEKRAKPKSVRVD